MGVDWSLREGYAWAEDKEHCEEYGRMLQADPNKVSSKAKKRGLPQVSHQPLGLPYTSHNSLDAGPGPDPGLVYLRTRTVDLLNLFVC